MRLMRTNRKCIRAGTLKSLAPGLIALALLWGTALPLGAQDDKDSSKRDSDMDGKSIGFIASKAASAKDIGLPLYPGAREHKDESDDTPAVRLGLWGRDSGFKLAVLKLESKDAPEKVATFYRKALAKYGKVLDCSGSAAAGAEKKRSTSTDELTCEDDQGERGEVVLKAGTKQDQHVVGIKTEGGLTLFQLVYVETRGN